MPGYLIDAATRHPEKTALTASEGGVTFADLLDRSARAATRLLAGRE